ncbi:MAG: hypothetical protein M1834_006205 [Cirrosporium novae-zelandiae]|nr:MAG: hypothetical protein M1834_006205 [Cirrosporium novae-zelandiae]
MADTQQPRPTQQMGVPEQGNGPVSQQPGLQQSMDMAPMARGGNGGGLCCGLCAGCCAFECLECCCGDCCGDDGPGGGPGGPPGPPGPPGF